MNVFDASALLAFVPGDHGADTVEEALEARGSVGAANWSETAQSLLAHRRDWPLARSLLLSYGLDVDPVTLRRRMGGAAMEAAKDSRSATASAWR